MQLTKIERWILSNQYHILDRSYPETEDFFREAQQAIEHGYEHEYGRLTQHIYDGQDVMTVVECHEVIDILDMFSALQRAYDALDDKAGIETHSVHFLGFDGNNEGKQMAYARYFCESDGRKFADLDHHDDFNSHMPTLGRYRAMLAVWKETLKHELPKEDIIRVVSAGR